jgi:DNA topoisomerase-3
MSKQLIIAEKPSVAADIARSIGGFTKEKDYFESEHYVLSSAVGHLLELTVPAEFEVKRGKWSFAHLPVIPPHFALNPIEKTEDRLKLLTRLIKRKDVTGLINACDAGREGELIFSFIVQHSGTTKPVQRLWLQSMTATAIRDGFSQLRAASDVEGLREAAVCRAESDWLIGINGTRAMTAFNSKTGGFHLTTVGRVQTPTLAIVVEREEKIRAFKPTDYWELEASFGCQAGAYAGRWFDEGFRKPEEGAPLFEHATAFRLWDKARAEAIKAKCEGKPGTVEEESKPSTQLSPLLFDLTSLQREANGRFGFSARTTLQLAQALYEKHKVLTYPRTDARALPEDYVGQVKGILGGLPDTYAPFANEIVKHGWAKPNKRIFNNAKISDHFAIIPTGTAPKSLSEAEAKIYDLVTRRFLSVFYPAAEYRITTRITRVEGEAFKTEGKILVNPGWLAVYGKVRRGERGRGRCAPAGGRRARREGQHRRDPREGPGHQAAGTLQRSHAAVGHGRCRQDGGRRGAARRDGRPRPRHPGHPGPDHREPDRRNLHAAGRQGAHPDRQGLLADHPAARPRHQRAHLARAHRRVGAQAGPDGARRAVPRRVHGAHPGHDPGHRRAGQAL